MVLSTVKNTARFSEKFLRLFSPEIQYDKIGLRNFIKLVSEDPSKRSTKKSVKQLVKLLDKQPGLKNLSELNLFLKATGSVSQALKLLNKLAETPDRFSLKSDLRILTDIFVSASRKETMLHALTDVFGMFSKTEISEIAPQLLEIIKADKGNSAILLTALHQAGRRMTDIQNGHLMQLGIESGRDAGEFFIQVAAALSKVSAHEILLTCANSSRRLVDEVRDLSVVAPEPELQQAA